MSNAMCETCGTVLIAGAKFCRQCGRLVVNPSVPAVTEATTRTLRTPEVFSASATNYIPTQPTGPAYVSPGAAASPPASATSNLEQRKPQRSLWLGVLLTTVLLIAFIGALFALGIIKVNGGRTITPPPPVGTIPEPPVVAPPDVPPPKLPVSNSNLRELIYPGAETMMDMSRTGGGGFLQLRSKDSFEKVLDWYIAKLKPTTTFKSSPTNAVLKSDKFAAIINSSGEGTIIILKEMGEGENDEP